MRRVTFALLFPFLLLAYSDSDMDGVEDPFDRCAATPFMDLVDATGCSVTSLVSPHHVTLSAGLAYSQIDSTTLQSQNTLYSTLRIDYSYRDFSLWGSVTSYNAEGDSGMNDTFIGAIYRLHPLQDLILSLGAGAVLPTYTPALEGARADYFGTLELLYSVTTHAFFANITYTQINDSDTNTTRYQDTTGFGVGYGTMLTPSLYGSLSYYQSDAIYEGLDPLQSASLYLYCTITDTYFINGSYTLGLSDTTSDHTFAFNIGFTF